MTSKEYKIGKGWAIFIYIFAPLLIALFVWLLIMLFVSEDTSLESLYFLGPVSIAMIALMFFGILDTIKSRVIISTDALSIRSTFVNRELKFEEIEGFRVDDKYIFVLPKTKSKKRIKISSYIGKSDEIVEWLSSNFSDLDKVNIEKEEAEILSSLEYGRNTEERSSQLKQAKIVSKILNWTGGAILGWTFFLIEPYEYAIVASISLPIISFLAVIYYKGLIRFDHKKNSAHPSVFFAFILPAFGLVFRSFDYSIFDYSKVWMPSIGIGGVMIGLLIFGTKEFKFKKVSDYFTVFFLSLFFIAYGYGSLVNLNCQLDESSPQIYGSKVIKMEMHSGRRTSYSIGLMKWGPQPGNDKVSVSEAFYNELEIGDNVEIYLRKGRFEIPWFIVTEIE